MPSTRSIRWSTLALGLAVAGASVAAQDAAPAGGPDQGPNVTYFVEVNFVEVDARVLDASGRFVTDLAQEDFQILEDGVVQEIDRFALVDIPVVEAEAPAFTDEPLGADAATNARPFDGRLYLFVLDDLHVSPHRTQQARAIARDFVLNKIAANDRAAVFTTRGSSRASQPFTDNRALLLSAVDNFLGQKLPSEVMLGATEPTVANAANPNPGVNSSEEATIFAPGSDPQQLQRALNADAAMTTLRNAAEFMAGVHGRRKALIYISEGIDYNIYDSITNQESSRIVAAAYEAMAAATRANVAIYAIDPRGHTTLGDDIAEVGGSQGEILMKAALSELQTAHDGLRVLAAGTGGFAQVNSNDAETAFDRIVDENSAYYMLGYYPTNTRRDGRTRRITVNVRRPGVQVFARDSYVEPDGAPPAISLDLPAVSAADAPRTLVETVQSPLPLSGLRLSATAAPFRRKDDGAAVTVVIEADGNDLRLRPEDDGRHTGVVELAVTAVNGFGHLQTSERMTTNLNLQPRTFSRLAEFGFRALLQLSDMAPGRYQFRVGALSTETGNRGSVFYDLEVPDFSASPLTMSGLLLASASASRAVTARPDTLPGADALPAAPTALREFPPEDEVAIFVEIYDNDKRPHLVDITSRLMTEDGRLVFTSSESRSSREMGEAIGGYGYTVRVPLSGLEPGPYVLKVEAESRTPGTPPVQREVPFRIRES